MKRCHPWTPLVCLLLAAAGCGRAQRPMPTVAQVSGPATTPARADAGWKSLFDGKTLTGWEKSDFFKPGDIKVQDSTIVMERGKHMTGITYVGGQFPTMDYEVTLEAKKLAGNDFFATTTFPVGKHFCSLVVGGWSGTVVGLSSLDFMDASMNETRRDREFEKDRWYRLRIRVTAKRIEAWIDQDKVVDEDTSDRRISIRVECNASTPFGIATYETTGVVRDIRVRSLTEAEKQTIAATKPEKKD